MKRNISDKVKCMECGKKFKIITSQHLGQHGLTLDEYIKKYPTSPTWSVSAINNRKVADAAHSKIMSGENNPFYGKKHTQETREKMSKAVVESYDYRREHNPESISHPMPKGDKSARWKGGYVEGGTRHKSRIAALKFYGHACMHPNCNFSFTVHNHHIIPKSIGGSYDLENCIILCPNHHAMADAGLLDQDLLKEIISYFLDGVVGPAIPYEHKLWIRGRR